MTQKKNKLDDITNSLKALKGNANLANKKGEKSERTSSYVPKGNNGGARPGSGRKSIEQDEKKQTLKRSWERFAEELIQVPALHKGTLAERKVKMARIRIAQETLFQGVLKGDVSAIKEFNNRVHGHPKQPIVGDDDEPPVQIDLGAGRILDKAYGTDEESD